MRKFTWTATNVVCEGNAITCFIGWGEEGSQAEEDSQDLQQQSGAVQGSDSEHKLWNQAVSGFEFCSATSYHDQGQITQLLEVSVSVPV